MKSRKILVWFRNDLRLHDNEMLVEAIAKSDSILPVYFFDPVYFAGHQPHCKERKCKRFRFLIESVAALREAFLQIGGNLLVINGHPEDQMPALIEKYEITEVYHHREVANAETSVSSRVEDLLWKLKVNLRHFIGHTLYNKEDLPFPIKDIPDVFAQFKKKTERDSIVKACFAAPVSVNLVEVEDWGVLPGIPALAEYPTGGERQGLAHLHGLLEEGAAIYNRPGGKIHGEKLFFSSKLSPWLALGCLSPRKVFWAVKHAEGKFSTHPNFSHLILGLLWRDYFRFMFKKHTVHFFSDIVPDIQPEWTPEEYAGQLMQWKQASTGHPLVDKYMAELNHTGFISHSGRLLVATYLIYIQKLNWLDGVSYFEEKLIDYSPASNWGNWANVAMGGKTPRSKNTFDLDKYLKILDPEVLDSSVHL